MSDTDIQFTKSDEVYTTNVTANDLPHDDWIKINENGEFICPECENTVQPHVSSENGLVVANLPEVFSELSKYPNKVMYAICPVCGMEYEFKKIGDSLYLKPSALEK